MHLQKLPAEARVTLATLHNASTNDYITAADRVVVEIPTNPARVSSNNVASSSTVFSTLLLSGKLQQREVVKAAPPALVPETTPLLQVIDRSSGSKFLVDTGASVSIFPPNSQNLNKKFPSYDLLTADGKPIASLNVETDSPRIMGVTIDPTYDTILQEFQSLTKPATDATTPVDSPVYHYIETTGPPVFSRPRRLDPEKLQAAKQEFNTWGSAEYVWVRHDGHRRPLQRPYNGPFKVISKSSKYFTIQGPRREETVTIDRLKPAIVPLTTNDGGPVSSSQTPGEIYISVPSPPPSPAPELPHSSTSTDLKTDPLKIEPLLAFPLKAESDISFFDSAGAKQCPQEVTTRSGRVSRPPDRYTSMVSLGPALTTRRREGYCGASKLPQRQFTYTEPPQRQFTHTQPPQHTKLPQRQFTGFTRAHDLVHSKSCETYQASEASTQKYINARNLEKGTEQHTPPLQPVLSLDRPPSQPPEHRPGPLDKPPCHCGKFSCYTSL
ncbi:hypothetical protein Pcinc_005498 [Petrolisthes cinctipes]|uniref:Peptidase A2 domain-containing protein n=1 Tax=Petrolisthes cinctipes TaxID=88211 RepID=A0AAE1GEZ9_PETCI|nr:hypothetical protein Pcinc_005498 [Petrolisthes cinctipes]